MAIGDPGTYLDSLDNKIPDTKGTWGYLAGTSEASLVLGGSKKVLSWTCHATTAGSMTINNGASIILPANTSLSDNPNGNLTDPTFVFTGTDSYYISYVV